MLSPAAVKFREALSKARVLRRKVETFERSIFERQIYYHASLSATVAAWESYVQDIIKAFFSEIALPGSYGFHALHTVAREQAQQSLRQFHTPNWDNSRNVLVRCIGYDPIGDWTWSRQGLGSQQVRELVNEILRVRHSFAHGHAMPSYSWNRSKSGRVRLTVQGLARVESLFTHLVSSTDTGIARLIAASYGRTVAWR